MNTRSKRSMGKPADGVISPPLALLLSDIVKSAAVYSGGVPVLVSPPVSACTEAPELAPVKSFFLNWALTGIFFDAPRAGIDFP